jgi:hypothetical protein
MSTHRNAFPILMLSLLAGACTSRSAPVEQVTHEERALAKAHASWAALFAARADETFSTANIKRFAPYTATLENGVWVVRGTVPAGYHGRTPEARIRAADGVTTIRATER